MRSHYNHYSHISASCSVPAPRTQSADTPHCHMPHATWHIMSFISLPRPPHGQRRLCVSPAPLYLALASTPSPSSPHFAAHTHTPSLTHRGTLGWCDKLGDVSCLVRGAQDHAIRIEPAQLGFLQVANDDDTVAFHLRLRVVLAQPRRDLAGGVLADVDLLAEELEREAREVTYEGEREPRRERCRDG